MKRQKSEQSECPIARDKTLSVLNGMFRSLATQQETVSDLTKQNDKNQLVNSARPAEGL